MAGDADELDGGEVVADDDHTRRDAGDGGDVDEQHFRGLGRLDAEEAGGLCGADLNRTGGREGRGQRDGLRLVGGADFERVVAALVPADVGGAEDELLAGLGGEGDGEVAGGGAAGDIDEVAGGVVDAQQRLDGIAGEFQGDRAGDWGEIW